MQGLLNNTVVCSTLTPRVARFCFLSLNGKFEYDIEYPEVRDAAKKSFLGGQTTEALTTLPLLPPRA